MKNDVMARMAPMQPELILASGSPQRKALLDAAGYQYSIVRPASGAECGVCSRETPPELVARLAWQKAADVAMRGPATEPVAAPHGVAGRRRAAPRVDAQIQRLIIGCDTVAECTGRILGKPSDREHARSMLQLLSGRQHHVYSGLCLWPRPAGEPQVRVAVTTLRMDRLSSEQIEEYLASGMWEEKAGAFGYQDRIDWLHIESGSESNVIGLPMELLAEMLKQLGYSPGRDRKDALPQ